MMIYMLAIAMTVAMLVATLFGLHRESQRVQIQARSKRAGGFGIPYRRG